MYLSHTTITLVLLMMLTATMIYTTIDLQKDQIITETIATAVDLKSSSMEHLVETSIPIAFNKVLNDMELRVIQSGVYYNNESQVLKNLTYSLESEINGSLENIKEEYSSEYDINYSFEVTNITMVDGFTFKVDYDLEYYLAKENVYDYKNVSESQEITIKTIISAYHYLGSNNNTIKVRNPNSYDLEEYAVKMVLDDTNFNFLSNINDGEIEVFDNESNSLPYWIEYWNSTSKNAIIWVKANITANNIGTFYVDPVGTNLSNGSKVFVMYDGFEGNTIFENISGNWIYNDLDSKLNGTYNDQMIMCRDTPIVSRIISEDELSDIDSSVDYYIVEVDAKGNNSDYDSPHVMLGYFANYTGDPTKLPLHYDSFYTLELGGLYDNTVPKSVFYINQNGSYNSINIAYEISDLLQISQEYAVFKNAGSIYIERDFLNDSNSFSNEETWYRLKVRLNQSSGEIWGTYSKLDDYVLNNGNVPNYNDQEWDISYQIEDTDDIYGSYFELGTSSGYPGGIQDVYFDNFRVRKAAENETEQMRLILTYISPSRTHGTSYGEDMVRIITLSRMKTTLQL